MTGHLFLLLAGLKYNINATRETINGYF